MGSKGNKSANKAVIEAIGITGMTTTTLPHTDYNLANGMEVENLYC